VLLYPDQANPKVTSTLRTWWDPVTKATGRPAWRTCWSTWIFIETTNGRQIKNEIVNHGAAWNGTTPTTATNYFETVTATDDNLKWALGLEADRMTKVKFTKQILDPR